MKKVQPRIEVQRNASQIPEMRNFYAIEVHVGADETATTTLSAFAASASPPMSASNLYAGRYNRMGMTT